VTTFAVASGMAGAGLGSGTILVLGLANLLADSLSMAAGAVPLLTYLVGLLATIDPDVAFKVSIVLSGLALFGLRAAKVLATERSWFRSGLEMLVVGGAAAGVAYLMGYLLQGLMG
jgi:VIT1/CCC1 family predicted Fe2+/Mn2+ transporter